ncbi:hypothetical protein CKO28_02825 [Rhodovibrio sodomensis]|uniref:Uncharacterized protein n=1 Tax=Rhodovibrio sodomensis TaxID=1088 RepID=A0ABS1D990_9PROT|nr:hypothetical protein [Rhodovibrio sodomensis]MBK1666976.1 hypothetical protein [Rhodovibrio sodomensis]
MRKHIAPAVALLALAALTLASLHTWASAPQRWILVDAGNGMIGEYASQPGCWNGGVRHFGSAAGFACRRK